MNVVTLILRWPGILIGVLFMVAALTACGDSGGSAPQTTPADSSPGRNDSTGSTSLDDYIAWCSEEAQESLDDSEEYTYEEVSIFYGGAIEMMESVAPPVEVADWHDKGLVGWKTLKRRLDAEPKDDIFNPLIIFADSEIVSRFEEVEAALDRMPVNVRERLASADCLGEDVGDAPIPVEAMGFLATCEPRSKDEAALVALYNATDGPNWRRNTNWLTDAPLSDWDGVSATRITLNGRVEGECVHRLSLGSNQLSGEIPAELGNLLKLQNLDLSSNWLSGEIPSELGNLLNLEDLSLDDNRLSGEIPSELGNLLRLQRLDLSGNRLSGEIPAELSNLPNLEDLSLNDNRLSGEIPAELGNLPNLEHLYLDDNQLSGRIRWLNETNPQYAWDGSTIRVSWDAVDGADYYKVYHDDRSDSFCSLERDGSPSRCEELATNVVGTTYVHTTPNPGENYYWVVSCSSGGCSELDDRNLAMPIETRPNGPTDARYALDGSTIRVSWDAVDGADYYKVYHRDDPGCRLDGFFCEELAANVTGTTYVHTNPASPEWGGENNYWVVSCNRGGCSEIDSFNSARLIDSDPVEAAPGPDSSTATPTDARYALDGSTIRVSWDAVDGADYYHIYYSDFFPLACVLIDGVPTFCEELATNVTGTTYVHTTPYWDKDKNYYWVVACSSKGCSEVDSENPARPE